MIKKELTNLNDYQINKSLLQKKGNNLTKKVLVSQDVVETPWIYTTKSEETTILKSTSRTAIRNNTIEDNHPK